MIYTCKYVECSKFFRGYLVTVLVCLQPHWVFFNLGQENMCYLIYFYLKQEDLIISEITFEIAQ